ncbi:MAG: hypothetical protein GX369_06640 [Euryarchaeota archaeon]|nr:hypothetical protein [Euryarchaeota archaeon]
MADFEALALSNREGCVLSTKMTKLVAVLSVFTLLGMGALLVTSTTTMAASSSHELGRVTVSGTDILIDGAKTDQKFFGVVDSTALAFAIENYINGNKGVAGWTSVFNGPDTGKRMPVTPNDTPDAFWNQYFAQMAYYDYNLIRIGPHDYWGTKLSYDAWNNHQEQFYDILHSMCYYAEYHGIWLSFSMGGSQQFPAFNFNGAGNVFVPGSQAFNNYIEYTNAIMVELEDWNSIFMYDVFNEPDHDQVYKAYWQHSGGKQAFNTWANAVAAATSGITEHPRNMGVAGFGVMFGMNQEDFNLATGHTDFEILHRHYYGSNTDRYNFEAPEKWAREIGKPLMWGELANNGPYPLIRYEFGEQAIWDAGGQLITAMVATGTPGYPYYGGASSDAPVPRPADYTGKRMEFISNPITEATVGHKYEYALKISRNADLSLSTNAPFLELDVETRILSGVPDTPGEYDVTIIADDGINRVEHVYTLTVKIGGLVSIIATPIGDKTYSLEYTKDESIKDISNVKWNLGDGNESDQPSIIKEYEEGEYKIGLEAVDQEGHVYSTEYMLDVKAKKDVPPTAGAIGAGGFNPAILASILLYGIVIGAFGYVELRRRDRF